MKNLSKRKIVVAMSGGIDSSVAATLLKRVGFEAIGVFMKLTDLPRFKENEMRAKKVAKILGIPLLVLDLRREFKERVINLFLKEYKLGLTPNPCIVCNKEIKFGLLLEKALSLNADYIATGHYARIRKFAVCEQWANSKRIRYSLMTAKDKEKDQSYFLWQLNQKQLKHILFPIGDYTKTQVRIISKKFKLPVLKIPESQEICFIKTTINDFLKKYLKPKPGQIIYSTPKVEYRVIGQHQGVAFYTIGQRKGIKLPGGPYWVLDKDLKKNALIVTKNEKDLYKKELIAKKVNWTPPTHHPLGREPKLPLKIKAKIRYRHEPASAVITRSLKSKVSLRFTQPQRAITPGQSVVFYKGQEVLGGGVISESC